MEMSKKLLDGVDSLRILEGSRCGVALAGNERKGQHK